MPEKLWLFNNKRADFWLPNFGFKRSLLSLLNSSLKFIGLDSEMSSKSILMVMKIVHFIVILLNPMGKCVPLAQGIERCTHYHLHDNDKVATSSRGEGGGGRRFSLICMHQLCCQRYCNKLFFFSFKSQVPSCFAE